MDRFLELEPGRRAVASKTFGPDEEVFRDHFPGLPLVPGVLLTEAMGQTGGWLLAASHGFERWPLLTMIASAKFRRLVRPGEEILLRAEVTSERGLDYEVRTEAHVGGEKVADARLVFHAFRLDLDAAQRETLAAWARAASARIGLEVAERRG